MPATSPPPSRRSTRPCPSWTRWPPRASSTPTLPAATSRGCLRVSAKPAHDSWGPASAGPVRLKADPTSRALLSPWGPAAAQFHDDALEQHARIPGRRLQREIRPKHRVDARSKPGGRELLRRDPDLSQYKKRRGPAVERQAELLERLTRVSARDRVGDAEVGLQIGRAHV